MKATFEEASKICSDQGLEVISIGGTKDAGKIDEYLKYIGINKTTIAATQFANEVNDNNMLL
jgi:hypothetical protein